MNEALESLVSKTLNLDNAKVAEILYSDAEKKELKADAIDTVLKLDAERVANLKKASKDELTQMHDKGYKKAQAETLSKFENDFKEQVGFKSDLTGLELIKTWAAEVAKSTEVDEQKVKLHPKFIELEKKLNSEFISKAEYDKVKAEYDDFKANIDKKQTLSVVLRDAQTVFLNLKPVLSKDPTRALNQQQDFLNKLSSYEFQVAENGDHVILKDGKRIDNSQGYPMLFKDFVKAEADKYFDFEQQSNVGNAGNTNTTTGSPYTGKLPQTEEEYRKLLATADRETSAKLMEWWKKEHEKK